MRSHALAYACTRPRASHGCAELQRRRVPAWVPQERAALAAQQQRDQKIYNGWLMKKEHDKAIAKQRKKDEARAAAAGQKVLQAKRVKAAKSNERHAEGRKTAVAALETAKAQREERKEQAKATQRAEEQAAKDYAARVRYETRPEVRKEGRDMFFALREAIVVEEKKVQAGHAAIIEEHRGKYLAQQAALRAKVAASYENARQAKKGLEEARRQDATVIGRSPPL